MSKILVLNSGGIEMVVSEKRPFVFAIKKETFSKYRSESPLGEERMMSRDKALGIILSKLP